MKTALLSSLRQLFRTAQFAHQHPDRSVDDVLQAYDKMRESRRKFLRSTAQAGALITLGGPNLSNDLWMAAVKPLEKIAIVGGGMSGLSAGYYLKAKGVKATIFEGDKRIGGRMKSGRIFGNGQLVTEIGAEFIDTNHEDMFRFVKILGLETKLMDVETDSFGEKDLFYLEGKRYHVKDVVAELKNAYPQLEKDRKKMKGRGLETFDKMPLAEYLDKMPVSPWMKKMLDAAYLGENGMEAGEQSASIMMSIMELRENDEFAIFGDSDERFKVIGGNEQIPQGLAEMLKEQIRYEHRLVSLRENNSGSITLTFNERGVMREETFDAVIMCLPFTVLRDINIQMDLPPIKRRVIKELGYGSNTKFILETNNRPWREAGYRGFLFNERISNGWDSSQLQTNNQGMGSFTCYYGGNRAVQAAKGTEKEQLDYILNDLEGAFPGTQKNLTGKMELAHWPGNPFIKASYSCFKAGQVMEFEGQAAKPVRNLYFAGEHTSIDYWGFMNGAAESGRIAAGKVLKKMGVK
jgi:monoamine oxidase